MKSEIEKAKSIPAAEGFQELSGRLIAELAKELKAGPSERVQHLRSAVAERTVRSSAGVDFVLMQSDVDPLPELVRPSGDPKHYAERLRTLIRGMGIELRYTFMLAYAKGGSTVGKIFVRRWLTPTEEFSTLVHELAHFLLQHLEHPPSRTVGETEAEAVAFVVGKAIGLDINSSAADYISLYEGDARILEESLPRIQRASSEILSHLLSEPELTRASERSQEQSMSQSEEGGQLDIAYEPEPEIDR